VATDTAADTKPGEGLFKLERRVTPTARLSRPRAVCESWPVYQPSRCGCRSIYAAAAERVARVGGWRTPTWARPGASRAEGHAYDDTGTQGLQALLARRRGRAACSPRRGARHLREPDGGEVGRVLTRSRPAGSEEWERPRNQPPGHLGISALITDGGDASQFWDDRAGRRPVRDRRRRHDLDAAEPRTPRRLAAAARGGRLLRPQRPSAGRPEPHVPAEPRRRAPQRTTPATRGRRSPRACRASSASPRPRTRTTATAST
jgi:hypothetical protein